MSSREIRSISNCSARACCALMMPQRGLIRGPKINKTRVKLMSTSRRRKGFLRIRRLNLFTDILSFDNTFRVTGEGDLYTLFSLQNHHSFGNFYIRGRDEMRLWRDG